MMRVGKFIAARKFVQIEMRVRLYPQKLLQYLDNNSIRLG
jgi:hypothetical protein